MHPNWDLVREKWPRYQVDVQDERFVDISRCEFIGSGNHELIVYTFGRYERVATLGGDSALPICIHFGIHFPHYVSLEEPSLGPLRSSLGQNVVGMPERALLLAIVSSTNGRAFWNLLQQNVFAKCVVLDQDDNLCWIRVSPDDLVASLRDLCTHSVPEYVAEKTPSDPYSISIDDIPLAQFPDYYPSEDELNPVYQGSGLYQIKKSLRKGGDGKQTARDRVVLKEDLRRLHDSLYKGQLGWTIPDPGFVLKKTSEGLWINVQFDSGFSALVSVYWLDFLSESTADLVSQKIIALHRNTPFDADPAIAAQWHHELPFFNHREVRIAGSGLDEVYGYTYASCMRLAIEDGLSKFPMKIGYSSDVEGALGRIRSQFPQALASDAKVLFFGRCENGRSVEAYIHRGLRMKGRKTTSAPGNEWFLTTAEEVDALFREACS